MFQARHVDADDRLWLLDLVDCERAELVAPRDHLSSEFRGWLSGFAKSGDRLALLLDAISPRDSRYLKDYAGLLFVSLKPDGPSPQSLGGFSRARLANIGNMSGLEHFLVRPSIDYFAGRLFAFDEKRVFEINVSGSKIVDAAVSPRDGKLAIVVRHGSERQAPRSLWVVRPDYRMSQN